MGASMRIDLGHGFTAVWVRGSHTVNFFDADGVNYDCCTFAWEKDSPTQMDAWNAFYSYEMAAC